MIPFIKFNSSMFIKHIIAILVFAIVYFGLYLKDKRHFVSVKNDNNTRPESIEMSFLDCFYFSLVTQSTVGYGDIVPVSETAKLINIMQIFSIFGIISL